MNPKAPAVNHGRHSWRWRAAVSELLPHGLPEEGILLRVGFQGLG